MLLVMIDQSYNDCLLHDFAEKRPIGRFFKMFRMMFSLTFNMDTPDCLHSEINTNNGQSINLKCVIVLTLYNAMTN